MRRNVSNGFKEAVKKLGREIDIIITYGNNTIQSKDINYFNYSYDGALIKSVMKKLEIEVKNDIELNTEINAQVGVKVNGSFEYIDYGNFIVYSSEKKEDTKSYRIICYDKLLESMKDYKDIDYTIGQTTYSFPMTLNTYIKFIAEKMGLVFYNDGDHFPNYEKILNLDPFLDEEGNNLGYTYRDILDDIAEATGSIVCTFNEDGTDYLELRYLDYGGPVLREDSFKEINVDFGKTFGPVNMLVLSRSGESDNVYYTEREEDSEEELCEIKIVDNQFMNGNDRSEWMQLLYYALRSLRMTSLGEDSYDICDYSSIGILYLDLCDSYTVRIGDNYYDCMMLSDEIIIEQGLEENVYAEAPNQEETDYSKADTTDKRINTAYLMVDKQKGRIDGIVRQYDGQFDNIESNVDDALKTAKRAEETVVELTAEGGRLEVLEKRVENNETTFKNMIVEININGINVSTNDSAISTLINNERFVVMNGNTPLAFFGYDSEDQTTKSYVEHLTVNTYFIAGHHRVEKIDINGEDRTGWFYIG